MAAGRELFKLYGLISMSGVDSSKKDLKTITDQAKKTQKTFEKLGEKVSGIGKKITLGLTTPIIASALAITKIGKDFDKAFTQSTAIITNLSDVMKKDMRKAAIETSKTVTFSAAKNAEAYFYLASAGLTAEQQIKALPRTAKFAQAGMFELSKATDLLTDAQSALGLSSKDTEESMTNMTRVSDVLVKANILANASVQEFSEAITNKAGAALRVLGKDIEEGVAVLAAFADQGLKGVLAGDALNIVLRDLQKSAINNEKAFKNANVSVFDSNGEMRNMADIISELETHLLGMSDKQRRAALTTLGFQDKSVSATMSLLGTSNAIREYEKSLRLAGGTTNKVAEEQLKNFSDQLVLVKNRIVALGLSIWESIGPAMNKSVIPAINKGIDIVEKLINKYRNLDPAMQTTVKGFFAIALALGPVVFFAGKFVSIGAPLITLLTALRMGTLTWAGSMSALQNSMLGTIAVITSLVAIGWYMYSQWDKLSVQYEGIWAKIKMHVGNGVRTIERLVIDGAIKIVQGLTKISNIIPGLTDKLKKTEIYLLRQKAATYAADAAARIHSNTINSQVDSNANLSESIKDAVKKGKEALNINKEINEEKKDLIKTDRLLSEQEKKSSTERMQFEKEINDQLQQIGKDKYQLLELERKKKIEEATKLNADILAVEQYYNERKRELLQEDEKERTDFQEKIKDQINQMTLTKLELLEIEKNQMLAKAEEYKIGEKEINALYDLKEAELKNQLREEEEKKNQEAFKKRVGLIQKYGNKINNVLDMFSNNELKRIDQKEKKEIDAIQNSSLSEEEKSKRISAIQEKTDKKRMAIEQQKAKRDKAASLFEIAINTAAAVTKALPNLFLAGLVGVLGAAEAIAVATQPLPFQDGALIKGSENGVNSIIGEKNTDEIVFPLERGIEIMAERIFERLNNIKSSDGVVVPTVERSENRETYNLNIGTLIATKEGLKELERKLTTIRIAENQRKGI